MQVSVFYPYKGTELYDICSKNKFLTNKKLESYGEDDTILNFKNFTKEEIIFAKKNFIDFVFYYRFVFLFPKFISNIIEEAIDFLWLHPRIFFYFRPIKILLHFYIDFIIRVRNFLKRKLYEF